MNLTNIATWRYSTKEFDPDRKIPADAMEHLRSLLRLSASSVNLQPWHFLIAESPQARRRMAKGTQGAFAFNEAKVLDASHVILFCVKTTIEDEYLEHLLEQEEQDGRFADPEFKEIMHNARVHFTNIHRHDLGDAREWMEKQLYLNMGAVLLGAAALGIDAVPMEGIDTKVLDEEFSLADKGFSAVAMVPLGYRKPTDFNAALPKSRLPEAELMTILD